ncbi:MAG: RNA polymerase sigma factor [Phycisphaerae bacterium]
MKGGDLDAIVRRACRRDPEALSALVEMYNARVFGLLYRLVGSRDVAEELLQETFLRVVRTIDRYEHKGRFESWLFRIAANLARDRARSGQRRGTMASLAGDDLDEGDVADVGSGSGSIDPHERAVAREDQMHLSERLELLSAPEREILMLRHYADMTFPEIADLLGVPLGTALARAHRALKRLRRGFDVEE